MNFINTSYTTSSSGWHKESVLWQSYYDLIKTESTDYRFVPKFRTNICVDYQKSVGNILKKEYGSRDDWSESEGIDSFLKEFAINDVEA